MGGAFQPATRYTITGSPRAGLYGGHLPAPLLLVCDRAGLAVGLLYNLGPVATFDVYRTPTIYARAVNVRRLHYALYRPREAASSCA